MGSNFHDKSGTRPSQLHMLHLHPSKMRSLCRISVLPLSMLKVYFRVDSQNILNLKRYYFDTKENWRHSAWILKLS